MASSLITRCPKCSTAFRVSDEVLGMAKGKVRCGQCFHIFNASQSEDSTANSATQKEQNRKEAVTPSVPQASFNEPESKSIFTGITESTDNNPAPTEEVINPDWLQTLFDDDDLNPVTDYKPSHPAYLETEALVSDEHNTTQIAATAPKAQPATDRTKSATPLAQTDQAPWEVELAEVEAALNASYTSNTNKETKSQPSKADTSREPLQAQTSSYISIQPFISDEKEPDYMTALHSLAQTAAKQDPAGHNQHSFLDQLSAQQNLAPLLDDQPHPENSRKKHLWLWLLASLLGASLLFAQAAIHFFDEGSRSSSFRHFYRSVCSYTGCVLPRFEDVSAISLQHVRIQSHPSLANTLLVNAIITNGSSFSQPMPKIALEFFDLNGAPVAARLFAPSDYLHKDFLDITYMPPETPIHLVIPIQDPGARAVTHQLKAFPTDTRSY